MSLSETSPGAQAGGSRGGKSLRDVFFSERRGNLYLLAIGLVVILSALVTLLLFSARQHALVSALPVAIVMAVVALALGNHLNQRRRCSPAIRLERQRLRYLGGNPLAPRLVSLAWDDIEGIENPHTASALRLRLKNGKQRSVPIAMLTRNDRSQMLEAMQQRLPVLPRRKRK